MNLRKQIIFDVDTKKAEELFGGSYRNLYMNIKLFMEKNGFEHIQGSAYESIDPMNNFEVLDCINALKNKYPKLNKCVKDIRQADIGEVSSLNHLFAYEPPTQTKEQATIKKETNGKGSFVKKIKNHDIFKKGDSYDVYMKVKIASCKTLQDAIREANINARKIMK